MAIGHLEPTLRPGPAAPAPGVHPGFDRPRVGGKFLFVGQQKLYLRGTTYGPFRPTASGSEYHTPAVVRRDFTDMAASGFNVVRVYTVPPKWLLDIAHQQGLRVMVGVPWEQHIAFLDDRRRARDILRRVRAGVRACAGHPALLCYVIGNEIPSSIVRWHGPRRIERFLKRLYRVAKAEDPGGLVTYVNYPSTEYLQLPFLDFMSFNVYLESQDRFEAYLARLQNLAGDRPLVMAEIGLDSRRNGPEQQAKVLEWQIRTAFAAGCAGLFLFSWTDEWFRGGYEIDDWDFGLTTRARQPKPALAVVRDAFADAPFPKSLPWPKVSVVICSYNGGRTIRDACEALTRVDYPDFEVIVVSDGSTDATVAIAQEYGFRVICTPNRGLSSARNTGMMAAAGEIVAYLDDDAFPDPQWLQYLAATFMHSEHAAVGGPNIPPPGDGPIADCVGNAPGGPIHVLINDREAEHIPGCNMAFRKRALLDIGGFDLRYWQAGDDVDACWRILKRGWTIGFSHAAMVWHHRRNSVRMYWKQQRGYGKAEALLEQKWPEKYNGPGHVAWRGRLYGKGLAEEIRLSRGRIYHGVWGEAPFQSMYQQSFGRWSSLPLMPEWYFGVLGALALSLVGIWWSDILWLSLPMLTLAIGTLVAQAVLGALRASFFTPTKNRRQRLKLYAVTAALHFIQPLARLRGRLMHGLSPWRRCGRPLVWPCPTTVTRWSQTWTPANQRLDELEVQLLARGCTVLCGGTFDRWDLEVRGGLLGSARMRMAIEEHGAGAQQIHVRVWPRVKILALLGVGVLASLVMGAAWDQSLIGTLMLLCVLWLVAIRTVWETTGAMAHAVDGLLPPTGAPSPSSADDRSA